MACTPNVVVRFVESTVLPGAARSLSCVLPRPGRGAVRAAGSEERGWGVPCASEGVTATLRGGRQVVWGQRETGCSCLRC